MKPLACPNAIPDSPKFHCHIPNVPGPLDTPNITLPFFFYQVHLFPHVFTAFIGIPLRQLALKASASDTSEVRRGASWMSASAIAASRLMLKVAARY